MIIISNSQRDSICRILERLETLDLPRTLRNGEMLRQAKLLRADLEGRVKVGREEFSEELLQELRKTK